MPWAMETRAGFVWATLLVLIFLGSSWAMVATESPALLIVPVLVYIGFLAWVNRVK